VRNIRLAITRLLVLLLDPHPRRIIILLHGIPAADITPAAAIVQMLAAGTAPAVVSAHMPEADIIPADVAPEVQAAA
jgi:hypothetical protein